MGGVVIYESEMLGFHTLRLAVFGSTIGIGFILFSVT